MLFGAEKNGCHYFENIVDYQLVKLTRYFLFVYLLYFFNMGSSESGKSALSIAESNLRTLRVPLILYGLIAGAALAYQPGSLVW